MGWDAFAMRDNKAIFHWDESIRSLVISDEHLRMVFERASSAVEAEAGTADRLLRFGGLDCSDCGLMLESLTGIDAWGKNLAPSDVAALTITPGQPAPGQEWVYYSALRFIEACKAEGLGIRFSW